MLVMLGHVMGLCHLEGASHVALEHNLTYPELDLNLSCKRPACQEDSVLSVHPAASIPKVVQS